MTHTALARKYRPTRFADLVAQEHVAAGLLGAVAKNRVAHAYLLTGPRGVGKTSAARILAMALNCERRDPGGEPCGACDSCRRIWSGAANLDVVEIDAASNRGVDDARDLRERAMYAASGPDRYKIYIIDEAHMLTREAWNALLKILEEPPPRVVFVFATTEPQKIANTAAPVLSRVQRFDFRRIRPQTIVERLRHVAEAEGVAIEDDAFLLIARVAAGGLRDALSVLDQVLAFGEGRVTGASVRGALGLIDDELCAEVLAFVAERRPAAVFPFVTRLIDAGADLTEFLGAVGDTLRALAHRSLGGDPDGLTESLRQTIERFQERFAIGDVLRMLRLLEDAETAIRRSPNQRLHVETLLLQWTLLDRTVELADVMAAVTGSGPTPAPSVAPPAATPRAAPPPRPKPEAETGRPRRPPAPDSPVTPGAPLTVALLRAHWDAIAEAVGRKSHMLREALGHAEPVAAAGGTVTLAVRESISRDGLAAKRTHLESAITEVLGVTARVVVADGSDEARDAGPAGAGQRVDLEGDRSQRMASYRAKDQALDAVAESLDLELLE